MLNKNKCVSLWCKHGINMEAVVNSSNLPEISPINPCLHHRKLFSGTLIVI